MLPVNPLSWPGSRDVEQLRVTPQAPFLRKKCPGLQPVGGACCRLCALRFQFQTHGPTGRAVGQAVDSRDLQLA